MSNKARVEAFRARWRKGADPGETDMVDLFHYIDALEAALDQHGHMVVFQEDGLFVEHPVECRRDQGIHNCDIAHALFALPGAPDGLEIGRYGVALDDFGELVFEELPTEEREL